MTQPALLVNSLLPRVMESYRSGKVSDFTLARYEEDARKIIKHHQQDGEMMLGLIEGLRHDAAAVHKHYQAAVAMGDDFVIHYNFVNAFNHAYDYQAARKSVVTSLRLMNRTDPLQLNDVSSTAFAYGLIDETFDLQQQLSKIKGAEFDAEFLNMMEFLKAEAVPHLQNLLMAVYGVLTANRLVATSRSLTRIRMEDGFFIEYVIAVDESNAALLAQYQAEADAAVSEYEQEHGLEPTPIGFRLTRSRRV